MLQNTVEVGGIEPACANFCFGWSETFPQVNNPFCHFARCLSMPLMAGELRQTRVTVSKRRQVSSHTEPADIVRDQMP
jgi:hypothetical protein